MNRVTLFGEWEQVYEGLMKQWCFERQVHVPEMNWLDWALAHISRGVDVVNARIREPGQLLQFIYEMMEVPDGESARLP